MDTSTAGSGHAPVPRPLAIVSECPWPSRNGVTAKTASLIEAWEVPALVLCPEHPFGPREQHLTDSAGAGRTRGRLARVAGIASAALRRGWVVQPGLERARVAQELRHTLADHTPHFVHFDTVATEHLVAPVADVLAERGIRVPLVLSINDSISELLRTRPRYTGLLGRLDVRMMRAAERRAYPRADAIDVVTPGDVASVHAVAPTARVRMLPLGASTQVLAADELAVERPIDLLLFATAGDWPLLLDELVPALREVSPDASVAAVGVAGIDPQVADQLDRLGVARLGFVDDLGATLRRTRVVVAPSQQHAGMPTKARDALSNGAAVVGGVCLHGLPGFRDLEHGLVADSGAGMGRAAHELLSDEERRARLARQGHELVTQLPDWATIARRYVDELPTVTGSPRG